ncbi:hypothetical protein N9E91_02570 [Alphaproteobacteria bacterium]|jgi:hypothetical protein|nr:hypothetical protein [Alphaproteobacteria bacterium]
MADSHLFLGYWLFLPQIWVIMAILFLLLELTDGSRVFFLPISLASVVIALLIFLQNAGVIASGILPDKWYWMLAICMVLALMFSLPMTRIRKQKIKDEMDSDDVNNY